VRALCFALFVAVPACITPNVLDSDARAVESSPAEIDWQPARAEDLLGLFESTTIEGEYAAALWKLYYRFAEDGTYTGAALIQGEPQPAFQTLSGAWKLDERGLDLGGGQIARAFTAEARLKLEVGGTTMIFRRVELP
jgi:hypothetical protein